MLEVLYDVATREVRAWCGDERQFGNFKPKEGQAVVVLPVDPPTFESDWYKVDLENKKVVGNPDYIPSVARNLAVEMDSLKERVKAVEEKVE